MPNRFTTLELSPTLLLTLQKTLSVLPRAIITVEQPMSYDLDLLKICIT